MHLSCGALPVSSSLYKYINMRMFTGGGLCPAAIKEGTDVLSIMLHYKIHTYIFIYIDLHRVIQQMPSTQASISLSS